MLPLSYPLQKLKPVPNLSNIKKEIQIDKENQVKQLPANNNIINSPRPRGRPRKIPMKFGFIISNDSSAFGFRQI